MKSRTYLPDVFNVLYIDFFQVKCENGCGSKVEAVEPAPELPEVYELHPANGNTSGLALISL